MEQVDNFIEQVGIIVEDVENFIEQVVNFFEQVVTGLKLKKRLKTLKIRLSIFYIKQDQRSIALPLVSAFQLVNQSKCLL